MTEGIWIAVVAAIPALLAAVAALITVLKKLKEIHVLVNSRLTVALEEIESLKKELKNGRTS